MPNIDIDSRLSSEHMCVCVYAVCDTLIGNGPLIPFVAGVGVGYLGSRFPQLKPQSSACIVCAGRFVPMVALSKRP